MSRAVSLGLESQGFQYAGLRRPDGTREEYEEETVFLTYYSPVGGEMVQVRWVNGVCMVVRPAQVTAEECRSNGWVHCGSKAVS